MARIIFVFAALMVSYSVQAIAASPAMVEKHIFSPEAGGGPAKPGPAVSQSNPVSQKLSRELLFTGVIRSPKGARVLIQDKTKGGSPDQRGSLKQGDEIKGMTLKEIGHNFIVLAGQGKEVRLNLFSEGKDRPAPAPEPPPPAPTAEAGQPAGQPPAPVAGHAPAPVPGQPAPGQASVTASPPPAAGQPAPATPSPAQSTPAQPATTKPQAAQNPLTTGGNPFLDAIKKAREQQAQGITPAPSEATDSTAGNPFVEAIKKARGY